jgi:hypothetical protein
MSASSCFVSIWWGSRGFSVARYRRGSSPCRQHSELASWRDIPRQSGGQRIRAAAVEEVSHGLVANPSAKIMITTSRQLFVMLCCLGRIASYLV